MPLRNAIPIINKKFEYCNDTSALLQKYIEKYTNWIQTSSNILHGLDKFTHKTFVHGTIQAFDHFYLKHYNKRLRFYRGEFMYHRACIKNSLNWSYIDDEPLCNGDAVVISAPFSDSGLVHPGMEDLLLECDRCNIPVLIDIAYICISKNIEINFNHPCIETVVTSISKAYFGAHTLRAGLRLQRENCDDGIDVFNDVGMVPTHSIQTVINFITQYPLDWNWNTYGDIYYQVCRELNLTPTNCIMFALGDEKYKEYNRGGLYNRVCISKEIGEKYASLQS